jgi:perosamine synthetase
MAEKTFKSCSKNINCGPLGLDILSVFSRIRKNNVISWFDNKKVIYFHKARAAIRYACEIINIKSGDNVLAPAYNCGVEIDPIIKSGAIISLYRIDENGQIDVTDLQKKIDVNTKIIYITYYFGFPQPVQLIRKICDEKGIYLIEDCALSLFSKNSDGTKIGSIGDISIFNLYKTMPLPYGGAMAINNPALLGDHPAMRAAPCLEVLTGLVQLIKHFVLHHISYIKVIYNNLIRYRLIKSHPARVNNHASGNSFREMRSSNYYDDNLSLRKMSDIADHMLRRMDYEQLVEKRRQNFQIYLHGLKGIPGIRFLYNELPEGVCPLFFPIITEDDAEILSNQLYRYSIVTIPWWNEFHKNINWSEYPDVSYLKKHLLALPVHQQLREKHIDYVVEVMRRIM